MAPRLICTKPYPCLLVWSDLALLPIIQRSRCVHASIRLSFPGFLLAAFPVATTECNAYLFSNQEKQNCEEKFTEVASSPNFTFVGNVAVGHPPAHPDGQSVQLRSLLRHYDAVLFAYGASKDRTLGVPGESLRRIYSAREFVGWYNGLPEFADLRPDLSSQDTAVVVGQGNVALDVARILLKDPNSLRDTDIAAHAAEALSRSRVRAVRIVGRRGPMQASFTIKELRELMSLADVRMAPPVPARYIPPDLKVLPRARRRLMEVLGNGPKTAYPDATKEWGFDFCTSPTAFLPDASHPDAVGAMRFQKNILTDAFDPAASISQTEPETNTMKAPLVFRSIGYRSEPIPEFEELGIHFDQRRGVIGNDGLHGRVKPTEKERERWPSEYLPGLYCAGWVKRGPAGVIASTMEDAFATAEAIAEDWKAGAMFLSDGRMAEERDADSVGWEGVKSEGARELAACAVNWEGWLAIDKAEREKGREKGKRREKFTAIEEMLPLSTSR